MVSELTVSRVSPVSALRTGVDRSVTGLDQSVSRNLGKYCWEDWERVTLRACYNWDLVRRGIGGCIFCVWDLVRLGWNSGRVSLGSTIGYGAGTRWWIFCLGYGSHLDGLLGTLGVGWWFMAGYFRLLSIIFIAHLVWAGLGLGIGTAGSGLSLGDSQMLEA